MLFMECGGLHRFHSAVDDQRGGDPYRCKQSLAELHLEMDAALRRNDGLMDGMSCRTSDEGRGRARRSRYIIVVSYLVLVPASSP